MLQDTKIGYSKLISPFRYKSIPAEGQVNLSARPLFLSCRPQLANQSPSALWNSSESPQSQQE